MKVHYISTEDWSLKPCVIEVLVLGKTVFVRESVTMPVKSKLVLLKQKWKLSSLSILSIMNMPANMAYKSEGDGYYNTIKFRGRTLNRISNSKIRGPKGYDEEGNLIKSD